MSTISSIRQVVINTLLESSLLDDFCAVYLFGSLLKDNLIPNDIDLLLLFHFMDTLYMALYDSPIYRLSSSRCSTVKIASQRQKILAKSFNCNRYQRNNFCACSLTSVKPTIK